MEFTISVSRDVSYEPLCRMTISRSDPGDSSPRPKLPTAAIAISFESAPLAVNS